MPRMTCQNLDEDPENIGWGNDCLGAKVKVSFYSTISLVSLSTHGMIAKLDIIWLDCLRWKSECILLALSPRLAA